jgi:hypothetical protein
MSTIINATTTNGVVIQPDNSGSLVLQTNSGTTAVTIDTSQRAAFVAGTAALPAITTTGDTNTGMFFPAADTIAFAEGGTEAMRLDSSGNVGIGTTSPITKLDVNSGAAGYALTIQAFSETSRKYQLGVLAGGALSFYDTAAAAERMRITSTGKCLFATTDTGLSGDFSIAQTTSASACMSLWNTATSGNNLLIQFYTDGGAGRGSIDLNRAAAQIRYNTTSDVTLKNLIGDSNCQKSTDILKSTRIREYAWKNDVEQKPQIGVIAQELYETYKGAVSVGGEYEKTDEQGNITKEYKPWEVDKTAFTFHLIAGWQVHEKLIQEQQTIINDLKARIEALEAK